MNLIPIAYRTIPLAYDESLSYYEMLCQIINRTNGIESELDSLEKIVSGMDESIKKEVFEKIKNELNTLKDDVKVEIAELQATVNLDLSTHKTEIFDEVEKAIQALNLSFEDFKSLVKSRVDNFNILVDSLAEYHTTIPDMIKDSINSQYADLKSYCDEIYNAKIMYYVKNPINGRIENVNKTLSTMFDACNTALNCHQYAELGLTAEEYAEQKLTCIGYLRLLYDKYMIKVVSMAYKMRNPFTGLIDSLENTVKKLVNLHKSEDAYTVGEYDALGITAESFDSVGISAYNFDFHSRTFFK